MAPQRTATHTTTVTEPHAARAHAPAPDADFENFDADADAIAAAVAPGGKAKGAAVAKAKGAATSKPRAAPVGAPGKARARDAAKGGKGGAKRPFVRVPPTAEQKAARDARRNTEINRSAVRGVMMTFGARRCSKAVTDVIVAYISQLAMNLSEKQARLPLMRGMHTITGADARFSTGIVPTLESMI